MSLPLNVQDDIAYWLLQLDSAADSATVLDHKDAKEIADLIRKLKGLING